jgi:4-amino-4-deoxy-L-arabinose transferase-like glycosyltransferase
MTAETSPAGQIPRYRHINQRLSQPIVGPLTLAGLLLLAITSLSLFLHLANIRSIGWANPYYTAAVESMLQSWHNFFFIAAEPGGSVTVDKPPLGLWIEAGFAAILGVNGFAVSLPNILAGVSSVPLLYALVKRYFGQAAGLLAALFLAVTPIAIAAARNNTPDAMLTFVLLLAAGAFIQATETGRRRYLWLGAVLVGLGFNIKMLQALLPLPAFFGLYFLASYVPWGRKLLHLVGALAILLIISLSWAVVVDLTPADQRPVIGSSPDNTVLSLITGYNGLQRLTGAAGPGNNSVNGQGNPTGGQMPPRQPPRSVEGQQWPPGMPGDTDYGVPPLASNPLNGEVGQPGLWRFFQPPLAKELSWFLIPALVGLGLALAVRPYHLPLQSPAHKGAVLWGGWLVTGLIFFSLAGFFHAYYLIMLAPPLAATLAMGAWRWWELAGQKPRPAAIVLGLTVIGTLIYQVWLAQRYHTFSWTSWLAVGTLAIGLMFLAWWLSRKGGRDRLLVAVCWLLATLLVIPISWSLLTVWNDTPSAVLPSAYGGEVSEPPAGFFPPGNVQAEMDEALVTYLQANTTGYDYLVAVPSSMVGAPLVLMAGRPVLYIGGFNGSDTVVDVAGLTQQVTDGRLRYILGGISPETGIDTWLAATCRVVDEIELAGETVGSPAAPGYSLPGRASFESLPLLYDCQIKR